MRPHTTTSNFFEVADSQLVDQNFNVFTIVISKIILFTQATSSSKLAQVSSSPVYSLSQQAGLLFVDISTLIFNVECTLYTEVLLH